ncbi:MAG: metallophosphoesterase [Treponema sp.]|nr:metallophosphoesterase [Treponema sp.]
MRRSANFFTAILIFSLSLISMTCKYGWEQAIYRPDSFRRRADSITELTGDSTTQGMLSALGGNTTYDVLLIADLHYGKKNVDRREDDLLAWIDSLPASKKPAFCINLGDSADHGKSDEYDDYLSFESRLKTRVHAVYNVVGNHDLYNSGWDEWKDKMYPHTSFYRFETAGLSWYFLDSGSGTLGRPQIENLKDVMEDDPKPKIVSMQYPSYSDDINMLSYFTLQDEHEVALLFKIFKENKVKLVLDGHTHKYFKNDFGSFIEFNVSTLTSGGDCGLLSVNESTMELKTTELP